MPANPINPTPYLTLPRISVASGLTLGRMLLTAIPDDPGSGVLSAAQDLQTAIDDLETQWMAKAQRRRVQDARPHDLRLDRAWSAVAASLERYRIFEADDPDHIRASELELLLFPTGLDFVKRPYIEQHAQSARRVELIETEGLREDLDRLVGGDFLDELLAAHEAYGVALGITEVSEDLPSVSLTAPFRALTRALSQYALQVLAFAGLDPESNNEAARRALEPIEVVRRRYARRNRGRESLETELDTPEEPLEPTAELDPATSAA